ncbi:MAG: hypothetical protein C4527_18210 [Candidatus Omnitrophota bacterium]|jgi:hypothetical protein|nr:MAG: hypothetical protein C4527_18210 [Candidatus Omnitrophota bacterium]
MFSEDTKSQISVPDGAKVGNPGVKKAIPERIIIRMWPKTPVLYPMAVFALICGICGYFWGASPHIIQMSKNSAVVEQTAAGAPADAQNAGTVTDEATAQEKLDKILAGHQVDRFFGTIFIILLAFSLFALCVDLEIRWALITFSAVIVVCLLLFILHERIPFLPAVLATLATLSPTASPQFYFSIFGIWVILMLITLFVVKFHYVKVESNEVVVVGGLLERQQRFPTIGMKYTKDVQDVIEYYLPLVNSGRLIFSFQDHPEAIVIDNVLQIEKVLKQLDEISSVWQVGSK